MSLRPLRTNWLIVGISAPPLTVERPIPCPLQAHRAWWFIDTQTKIHRRHTKLDSITRRECLPWLPPLQYHKLCPTAASCRPTRLELRAWTPIERQAPSHEAQHPLQH